MQTHLHTSVVWIDCAGTLLAAVFLYVGPFVILINHTTLSVFFFQLLYADVSNYCALPLDVIPGHAEGFSIHPYPARVLCNFLLLARSDLNFV